MLNASDLSERLKQNWFKYLFIVLWLGWFVLSFNSHTNSERVDPRTNIKEFIDTVKNVKTLQGSIIFNGTKKGKISLKKNDLSSQLKNCLLKTMLYTGRPKGGSNNNFIFEFSSSGVDWVLDGTYSNEFMYYLISINEGNVRKGFVGAKSKCIPDSLISRI